jgi:HSP20 family protein
MTISDLIPWRREQELPASFSSFQREMNRMFEDFFGRARRWPASFEELGTFLPSLDVSETEDAMEVSAELPGMTEKDIDVTLSSDRTALTIKGEKKQEKEKKEKGFYHSERSYGLFRRTIALPAPAKEDQIQATFLSGVLTIQLKKDKAGNGEKHIKVKTA